MQRTIRCFRLVGLVLATAVTAAAQPRPSLRIAVPADRAEAFMGTAQAAKDMPGFDYELLEGFSRLRLYDLQVVVSPTWDGLIPMLIENKADLIAGGYTDTAQRRKQVDFTVEVFPTRDVVVTRKPQPPITTLEALRAATVITHHGTSMTESLLAAGVPESRISYVTSGGVADALRARRVTAGVLGLEVAILAQKKDPELELGLFLGQPASIAYGVRKGDTELKKTLDEFVTNVRRTTTWSRLVVKYFGDSALDILRAARKP